MPRRKPDTIVPTPGNATNSGRRDNGTNDDSLFNNPMTRAAMSALSDEDLLRYKRIGEELYGSVDFEATKVLNNLPPSMIEGVAYVQTGLDSGLHPSDMEENEKALMADAHGDEWYKRWGYSKADLDEIK